jgi:hypothetical protein
VGKEEEGLDTYLQRAKTDNETRALLLQRLTGQRVNPYAGLPEMSQYSLTPQLRARAEQLVQEEQNLPPSQQKGYPIILDQLLRGTVI